MTDERVNCKRNQTRGATIGQRVERRDQLIREIKDLIRKGDEAAEEFYVAAGRRLKELRKLVPSWEDWETFLKEHVGIGRSRASELMRIASGETTAEEVCTKTAERQRRHRDKAKAAKDAAKAEAAKVSPLRNGDKSKPADRDHDVAVLANPASQEDYAQAWENEHTRALIKTVHLGLLRRCDDAITLARFSDEPGMPVNEELVEAARNVAKVWNALADKLADKMEHSGRDHNDVDAGREVGDTAA